MFTFPVMNQSFTGSMSKDWSKRVSLLGLVVCMALWAFLLRHEATYSGFDRNDFVPHEAMARHLLNAFKSHELGLDSWYETTSLGAAVFRTYQNLAHILVAFLALVSHAPTPLLIHLLTVVAIILQCPAAYYAARGFGFKPLESLAVAWLAPLPLSAPVMGHDLESYVYIGYGLFTQALSVPPLLMAWGSAARVSQDGGVHFWQRSLQTGLWSGLAFSIHHFYGYFALLFLVLIAFRIIREGILTHRQIGVGIAAFTLGFLMLSGYQLLSIFQDRFLMHRSYWDPPQRWNGIETKSVFQWILGGYLLDYSRFPLLTGLTYFGTAECFFRSSKERTFLWIFLGASIFLVGRAIFGNAIDFFPGMSSVHLERFAGIMQLAAVFLAALGIAFIVRVFDSLITRKALARGAALVISLGILGVLTYTTVNYVQKNDELMNFQTTVNSDINLEVFKAAAKEIQSGYSGFSINDARFSSLRFGWVSFYDIAMRVGIPRQLALYHEMTHTSIAVPLFNEQEETSYRIFNVSALIVPSQFPKPSFLKEIYTDGKISAYSTPATGPFGVISIPNILQTPGETAYVDSLKQWLKSPAPDRDEYPSIIPTAIATHFSQAVPTPSPTNSAPPWGEVKSWAHPANGKYEASLFAKTRGYYGMLRTAYHPRWQVLVNQKRITPKWVAPGFIAFELAAGLNEVKLSFPPDPFRTWLFFLGVIPGLILLPILSLFENGIVKRLLSRVFKK